MRACIQRVSRAQVDVGGETVGSIEHGLLVLLGVADGDNEAAARLLAGKLCELRIFDDEAGKMNHSLRDTGGAMLVVSQFTLLADCRKGRRPSYIGAAAPDVAERLYLILVDRVRQQGITVATGKFRAHMTVSLVNDGPVTILLDTREL